MSALHGTDEIIEVAESCDSEVKSRGDTRKQHLGRAIDRHGINNDINKLFEAIEVGSSHPERYFRHKSAMKRPMRVGSCQASGIGISESVSLKQALRGLCISQASEMAAVKKRMSRPSSAISEVGAIKKLNKGVVIETNQRVDEVKGNMVEISIVPVRSSSNMIDKKISESDEMVSVLDESSRTSRGKQKERVDELRCGSLSSNFNVEQSLRTHNVAKKKIVPKKPFVAKIHNQSNGAKNDHNYQNYVNGCEELEKVSPSLSSDEILVIGSSSLETDASTHDHAPSINSKTKSVVMKADERSRAREKGEFSQSSKSSSIGEYSCTTSNSEESYLSGSSRSGYRPHMSKDLRWEAIRSVEKQHGRLGMKDFKLLRKIGGGDIGIVYLCELIGTSCFFAVKVMDNEFLASRKKMHRAQTEKEIMEILDHPFLPTLYAHFTTAKYSCLVMEYCPGGDLHVLRQKQPTRSFPEKSARFYAAEILLALEYLHMLGVVYRDLKPENILVREDGHIMLSDFDLSLRCPVNPMLLNSSSKSSPFSDSTCIHPFCLQPSSWQLSCFTPSRFLPAKTRKQKSELAAQVIPLPQLVVEPITARSNSFVGTHEYLAPEIIKGEGHGSAVDWWTFGVLLYEILYGKTPFKGTSNEDTISNVVSQCLKFPQYPNVSSHAQDLIRRLLKKEPENRMGSAMGAAEIKQHPFFEGLNWALIRCETPPISFDLVNVVISNTVSQSKKSKSPVENENGRDEMAFEMF